MKSREFQLVETRNFSLIRSICTRNQELNLMSALVGFSGAGKTTAFEYVTSKNKNAMCICLDKTMKAKDFYLAILNAMDVFDYSLEIPVRSMSAKITSTLNKSKGNSLLIIDDAGRFTPSMLEYIQQIRDSTQNKAGILLAGTVKFKNDMHKWVDKNVIGMPELFTRIAIWEDLVRPEVSDVTSICEANGILDKEVIKSFYKRCKDFRSLRHEILLYQHEKGNITFENS